MYSSCKEYPHVIELNLESNYFNVTVTGGIIIYLAWFSLWCTSEKYHFLCWYWYNILYYTIIYSTFLLWENDNDGVSSKSNTPQTRVVVVVANFRSCEEQRKGNCSSNGQGFHQLFMAGLKEDKLCAEKNLHDHHSKR